MQEIINKINILNLRIEDINSSLASISKSIDNFYLLFQKHIPQLIPSETFFDKYTAAIFGLIGVILGSLISYIFNRKITKDERMAKILIQRKNLIYAPIFKELLQLTDYISQHPETCYINILTESEDYYDAYENEYFYDGDWHESAHFLIWNEMKNDIRKDYIPEQIQKSLNEINRNLKTYTENRDKIDLNFKEAYKNQNIDELYKEADRKKHNKQKGDTILGLNTPAFLFKKEGNFSEGLNKVYKQYGDFSEGRRGTREQARFHKSR